MFVSEQQRTVLPVTAAWPDPPELVDDPERARQAALLDVAVSYLVAHPRASLAQIAAAADIGRTTLFKLFATRDELEQAVALRAMTVCQAAVDTARRTARDDGDTDGGLRALVTALLPVGPQLNFVWRTRSPDVDDDVSRAQEALWHSLGDALGAARRAGVLREVSTWWLEQVLLATVYIAWESVQGGRLARLDATDLVLDTLFTGIGGAAGPHPAGATLASIPAPPLPFPDRRSR